jgi:hypothetical protein
MPLVDWEDRFTGSENPVYGGQQYESQSSGVERNEDAMRVWC